MSDYGVDLAKREIYRLSHKQRADNHPYRRDSADAEVADLTSAKTIMERLESSAKLVSVSNPILWHTDLHLGNIYVSEDEPTRMVSIIDWQYVYVGPTFLQANWPEFLKPNDEYICGVVHP